MFYFRYDLQAQTWSNLPDVAVYRTHHCVVVFENHLYAIGGIGVNGQQMSSVEKFYITEKRWVNFHNLTAVRSSCVATVIDGCIYVIGRDYVERLNPNTGATLVGSQLVYQNSMIFLHTIP